jgi:hypothetical protein
MRLSFFDNTDIWRDRHGQIIFLVAQSTKPGTKMKTKQINNFHFDNELSLPRSAMYTATPTGTSFNS